jgi:hypothetical protein
LGVPRTASVDSGRFSKQVDLIPTEYVTAGIDRLLDASLFSAPVFYHFSRGESPIRLGELIELCASRFSRESEGWKRGRIQAPIMASRPAFEEFHRSVVASRDLLFTQVLESVDSFLPELFFPKRFSTTSTIRDAVDLPAVFIVPQ